MQESTQSGHLVFRCSSPLSRGVLKRLGGRRTLIRYNADPISAEMLMKTTVSVSMNRAVLIWYLGRRCEGDIASPNTNFHIAQNLVTHFTRHESPDLFHLASITQLRSARNKNSTSEFKSPRQVSREAGFSKLVEVEQYFVTRPVILLTPLGTATTCREDSAMRDDSAVEATCALEDNTIFRPIHDAKITLRYGRYRVEVQIDSSSGDGSKP